jgi:hypothetical protein
VPVGRIGLVRGTGTSGRERDRNGGRRQHGPAQQDVAPVSEGRTVGGRYVLDHRIFDCRAHRSLLCAHYFSKQALMRGNL